MEDNLDKTVVSLEPITLDQFLDIEIGFEEEEGKRLGIESQTPRESDLKVAKSKMKLKGDDSDAKRLLDERIKFLNETLKYSTNENEKTSFQDMLGIYTELRDSIDK